MKNPRICKFIGTLKLKMGVNSEKKLSPIFFINSSQIKCYKNYNKR